MNFDHIILFQTLWQTSSNLPCRFLSSPNAVDQVPNPHLHRTCFLCPSPFACLLSTTLHASSAAASPSSCCDNTKIQYYLSVPFASFFHLPFGRSNVLSSDIISFCDSITRYCPLHFTCVFNTSCGQRSVVLLVWVLRSQLS